MNLTSKYFDCIRIRPDAERKLREEHPACQWRGCANPGKFPAPRGRGREGQYFKFCLEHVRAYNKSYNYFDGMSDEDVGKYLKANVTGHRPTWSVGSNGRRGKTEPPKWAETNGFASDFRIDDPFGVFGQSTAEEGPRPVSEHRTIRNVERKSLTALNLDETATSADIKARYKELVKRLHPDSNGGDRRAEDKLREVIQAYKYLRQVGLC